MNHKVLLGVGACLLIVAITVLLVIQINDTRKLRESQISEGVWNTTAQQDVVLVSTIYGGDSRTSLGGGVDLGAVIGVPGQCKENEIYVPRRRKCERVY